MAKKRKKRRTSAALNEEKTDDLIGGIAAMLTGHPPRELLFDSELQRRAVYMANRERLIDLQIEYTGPGRRPDAFWEYEGPKNIEYQAPYLDYEPIKYLIENNQLREGELESLIAEYILTLEPYKSVITVGYENQDLPGAMDKYKSFERLAQLLGGAALNAWEEFKKELEDKNNA